MRSAADEILLLLKTRGAQSTADVGEHLNVTRQAARQHLESLLASGFLSFQDERKGVGRPSRTWSLTERGHSHFPDAHAQVAVELLGSVRAEFGEAGLSKLISRRERQTRSSYEKALEKCKTLESRVARLSALRTAEGYMSEWSKTPDGTLLLVENHCPICAAAKTCQGFCRSELALFRKVLDARVERTQHILEGARRCAYRIAPK